MWRYGLLQELGVPKSLLQLGWGMRDIYSSHSYEYNVVNWIFHLLLCRIRRRIFLFQEEKNAAWWISWTRQWSRLASHGLGIGINDWWKRRVNHVYYGPENRIDSNGNDGQSWCSCRRLTRISATASSRDATIAERIEWEGSLRYPDGSIGCLWQ